MAEASCFAMAVKFRVELQPGAKVRSPKSAPPSMQSIGSVWMTQSETYTMHKYCVIIDEVEEEEIQTTPLGEDC